ncbi:MAG: tetratricopeptide repeat protein [Gemmatimonadales bacterium]|nr:MAG: tetratricopeptide repeat protein [Gemmatimonadales bacterium]
MKIDTLKQQAREHELAEEWGKALSLYRRAADALEEAEEPDIALLNRMADLQVRNGDMDAAIETYDEAIDLYLESDLPNNAIAICRKMIRNAPGRPEIFRRMGEIRAKQGFVVDARQSYLTYAEMMEARGERDVALKGLKELVTLVPDDVETRMFLGEQLISSERVEEGVSHLLHAWKVLERAGADERSEELAERIRAVDPEVRFPSPDTIPEDASGMGGEADEDLTGMDAFESTGLGGMELSDDEVIEVEPAEGLSDDFGGDFDEEFDDGFHLADDDRPSDLQLESAQLEDDEEVYEDPEPSPVDGFESTGGDFEFNAVETGGVGTGDLDVDDEDDVPESEEPLPLLGAEDEFDFGGADEAAPGEGEGDSLKGIRERIATDPDDPDRHEELVEFAYRTNDRGLLLSAFVGLAGALARSGSMEKATSVYEQVLQLDPSHPVALDALGRSVEPVGFDEGPVAIESGEEIEIESGESFETLEVLPEDPPPIPTSEPETPPAETFVDLGAMILDDDEVGTTRWVAPGHEPSGDEGMDFASMLSDFKDKVARNLDHEDSSSRYDLGAAYREMGLLDEAISMFQAALRAKPAHLGAIEMMGQCFLDKDEPKMAARVLSRALELPRPIEDDLLGIYYYLAVAHERAGNPDDAREFYEKVFSLDINFKDVTERLRGLR